MLKKLFLFLSVSFVLSKSLAQNVPYDLQSTEVVRDKLTERAYNINKIGKAGDFSYFLFMPYQPAPGEHAIGNFDIYRVGRFDKNMKLLNKQLVDLTQKPERKDKKFEGILLVNGKLVVFTSFQNQKDKKNYVFVQHMNNESLAMENDIKLAGQLDYSGYSKYSRTAFTIAKSPDESKILVFYTLLNKDNETLRSGLYVFDNNLNLKWEKDNITPGNTAGIFSYQKFTVDNSGNVYLLGLLYADRENYFDGAKFREKGSGIFSNDTYYTDKPNYVYHLYRLADGGKKEDHYKLEIPNKFVRSLNLSPSNNSVICTGIYSNPGTISAVGSFAFSLNTSTGQIGNVNTKEFGTDLISQGFEEDELKRFKRSIDDKSEWDPFDYIISDLKTKSNGETYFVAEQFISGTKKERSGNMVVYKPIYLHKDLFVVTLGADSKIKRIDKIVKNQYMLITQRFSSYTVFETSGVLNFLYNTFDKKDGLIKNLEIGESYLVRLDAKGNQEKIVFKKKDSDLPIPMPGTGMISGNSITFALMSSNMKDYQIQTLSLK